MSAAKSERLLNLVILLLVSRGFVGKARIRESIEAYRRSGAEAFEKMFERDKDDLRALGIPVELGSADPLFGDEPGYRIRRDEFELPEIDFTPEEVAVLGLAARVWQSANQAEAASTALMKLRAAGHDVDRAALDVLEPRLVADEPAFDALWEHTVTRTPVRFGYRRPGEESETERHLEPWAVVTAYERWYVVGHDRDRGEARVFRLSRIRGEVRPDGAPGSYDVPRDVDVHRLAAGLAGPAERLSATVLVRRDRGIDLRRRARRVVTGVAGPDERTAWDEVVVEGRSRRHLAEEVLALGEDAVLREPESVRELVIATLVAAGGRR